MEIERFRQWIMSDTHCRPEDIPVIMTSQTTRVLGVYQEVSNVARLGHGQIDT